MREFRSSSTPPLSAGVGTKPLHSTETSMYLLQMFCLVFYFLFINFALKKYFNHNIVLLFILVKTFTLKNMQFWILIHMFMLINYLKHYISLFLILVVAYKSCEIFFSDYRDNWIVIIIVLYYDLSFGKIVFLYVKKFIYL